MAINLDNRVIHRFIQDISAYEIGGEFYSQVIPLDTQAYAVYHNEEGNNLYYVIGDGEHTYTELRDGHGNGEAYKEYPVLSKENLNIIIDGFNDLNNRLTVETQTREEFDNLLDEALSEEIENRKNEVETVSEELNGKIDSHVNNKQNPHDVTKEQIGLGNVDNTSDMNKPISTAVQSALDGKQDQLTESQLQAINSGVTDSVVTQVNTNTNNIQNILDVIPNAASNQNQLADKQFVIDSVIKESATFRGTYNSVEELNAYAGEKDNNDYAYVITTDELGNKCYDEYKYNGTQWLYEFTLSGSTFTSDQWEAINSGATSSLITQITTNQNDIQQKQDILVNQENIKSINGYSLLGSGNLEIASHLEYPSTWPTNSSTTTKQFCDAVAADATAVEGKTYLGEVRWNDLPGLVNGEVEVEIMTGTTASSKVIVLTLASGNKAPYMWKYTYWNGGHNVSGWKGFVPTSNVANIIYGTDSNGNQTTYSAGNGISIANGVISNTQTSAEWGNISGTLSDQIDLQNALNDKVSQSLNASVVYGTDAQGAQTTYDVDSFGAIDDVQINGTSVVSNKIASLTVDNTPVENSTNLVTSGAVYSATPSIIIRDWSINNE